MSFRLTHRIVQKMRGMFWRGSVLTVVRHYFYGSVKCHWSRSGTLIHSVDSGRFSQAENGSSRVPSRHV